MSSEGSISYWIKEIKPGNPTAAEVVWDRYFPQLLRLARGKLRGLPGTRRRRDKEMSS